MPTDGNLPDRGEQQDLAPPRETSPPDLLILPRLLFSAGTHRRGARVLPEHVRRRLDPLMVDYDSPAQAGGKSPGRPDWVRTIAVFSRSDTRKALWQLINTIVPYLALLALMTVSVVQGWPYVVTLALAVPAAGLAIRIFIFCHDCCHDSYFTSRWANRIVGTVTGILTFTPFDDWKRNHIIHHATAGDLDNRGTGDVWTMTVGEYLAAPRLKRLGYRLVRNPFFLLLVVPFWLSMVAYRIPHWSAGRAAFVSVMTTNLVLGAIVTAAAVTVGWQTYFLVQVPVTLMAWTLGVWLFYVQHQY